MSDERREPIVMSRRACQWPIGEPRTKEFHFCGKPVIENRPYCAEHLSRAMTKVVNRQMLKTLRKV